MRPPKNVNRKEPPDLPFLGCGECILAPRAVPRYPAGMAGKRRGAGEGHVRTRADGSKEIGLYVLRL